MVSAETLPSMEMAHIILGCLIWFDFLGQCHQESMSLMFCPLLESPFLMSVPSRLIMYLIAWSPNLETNILPQLWILPHTGEGPVWCTEQGHTSSCPDTEVMWWPRPRDTCSEIDHLQTHFQTRFICFVLFMVLHIFHRLYSDYIVSPPPTFSDHLHLPTPSNPCYFSPSFCL